MKDLPLQEQNAGKREEENQQEIARSDSGSRIRARHVLILGALGALGPLANDMYVPALPSLSHDLLATTSQAQMTLSAFILGLALGQVVAGPISDAIGRRWPLVAGVVLYALISLLCLVAPSIGVLVVLRFVQGVAGAAGVSLSLAVASDLYAGRAQARFFSLLMQINGLAPMAAPVIGSQLLRFTSWQGIFVTLALFGALLVPGIIWGVGETLPGEKRQRGGLTTTLRAFRDLLADRRFVGYALSCGFAFTACIIYISVSPFILQNSYGVSAQMLGIVFGGGALGIVLLAQVNSRLVNRFSPRVLLTWGYALLTTGGMAILLAVLGHLGLFALLPSFFLLVASLGLIMPNATTLAFASVRRAAGSASALLGVLQLIIGALIAPLVGLGGSSNPLPMALAIAAFALATLLTFLLLCRPPRVQAQGV